MREIKFRGYAVEEMVGSQWLYGTGIHVSTFTDDFFKETGIKEEAFLFTESGWLQVYKESVGQYVDLLYKNGKEIYEGDIVNCCSHTGEHNAVIKFGEYHQDGSGGEYLGSVCIGFYAEAINKNATDEWGVRKVMEFEETASLYDFPQIEVIGNIHEHPHLLKGDN